MVIAQTEDHAQTEETEDKSMKRVSVEQIVQATRGQFLSGDREASACSVATDTRKTMQEAIFFALLGENFDAHGYIDKAAAQGATVIVCQHVPEGMELGDAAVVQVEDTLVALQQLAKWYRGELSIEVVGITGSNGKTSTKDFAEAVLSAAFSVNATKGNLNNHIGLPLTVLETEAEDTAAIFEMGMNHAGEIAPLCEIAQPRIGIITNIGSAHIEFMGTLEAIADEKGELAKALPKGGVLFVPSTCDYVEKFRSITAAKLVEVGGEHSSVRAENLNMDAFGSTFDLIIDGKGATNVMLPVVGEHMVTNALLAAAVGSSLGMAVEQIADALSSVKLTSGRLRSFDCNGVRVIDDTYNANPESVRAAIDTLAGLNLKGDGSRFVVLGKMGELGDHASQAYLDLGAHAAKLGLHVVSVDDEAKEIFKGASEYSSKVNHFSSVDQAGEWLQQHTHSGDAVLFKGSRAAAMERVMNQAFVN